MHPYTVSAFHDEMEKIAKLGKTMSKKDEDKYRPYAITGGALGAGLGSMHATRHLDSRALKSGLAGLATAGGAVGSHYASKGWRERYNKRRENE